MSSSAELAPWPLLRSGQADIFQPVPLGIDVRGRGVKVPLIFHNWLIGSIPRKGKTNAVRVPAFAPALDPLAELWIAELKAPVTWTAWSACRAWASSRVRGRR